MRFGHAGLRRFWERGDASRLNPAHIARVERLLDDLADASNPAEMDLPGLQLHQLTGNRRGTWAVRVSELAADLPVRGRGSRGREP